MFEAPAPTQTATTSCRVIKHEGGLAISLNSDFFPSLLGVEFSLTLMPETTHAEAEALAAQLDRQCPGMLAGFRDHSGLSAEEQDALVELYDDMGLLEPSLDELKARCAPAAVDPGLDEMKACCAPAAGA